MKARYSILFIYIGTVSIFLVFFLSYHGKYLVASRENPTNTKKKETYYSMDGAF
jgi:hypothetical protein